MKHVFLLHLLLAGLSANALAIFLYPDHSPAPVERLVASAERYVNEHRRDADAHYTLARIHYLAFSRGESHLISFGPDKTGRPQFVDDESDYHRFPPPYSKPFKEEIIPLSAKRRRDHAVKCFYAFKQTMQLDPEHPVYALGYASFLRSLVRNQKNLPDLPTILREVDFHAVRGAFAHAMALAQDIDGKRKSMPLDPAGPRSLVTYEAATNLVELSKEAPLSRTEKREVTRARETIKRIERLPTTAVTPIVFSLQPKGSLQEHLASDATINFDLRGYGFRDRWPWVRPDLALLVWDPKETGRVESAVQLFGNYTFEIFWKDGYHALSALDDNGDGALTGGELDGLSAWFDSNSDGRSAANEVIPLCKLLVTSIDTRSVTRDGPHLKNPEGITFADGRKLPTWDWVVRPHPQSAERLLP